MSQSHNECDQRCLAAWTQAQARGLRSQRTHRTNAKINSNSPPNKVINAEFQRVEALTIEFRGSFCSAGHRKAIHFPRLHWRIVRRRSGGKSVCTRSPRLTTAVPHDISPVVALDGACLTDGVRRLRSFLHPTLLLLVEDDVLVAQSIREQ
jgi:hypothetical protein